MGACTFMTKAKGKTAQAAFNTARDEAQWEHGHGGYTGTIAEKGSFVTVSPPIPDHRLAYRFADEMLGLEKSPVSDKWGPAGCVPMGKDEWLFFGWASE